ncbi:aminotransferase class V-fold PLP-dependent enzyme [Vibrio mimicus]|uniref:aminotransferase class V-fold PLP-dependent enzyme n=1 Tax=Vibrio mimicus TaxID=674 RepID=UPI002F959CA8
MNKNGINEAKNLFDYRFKWDRLMENNSNINPFSNGMQIEKQTNDFSKSLLNIHFQDLNDYEKYLKCIILPNSINLKSDGFMGHMTGTVPYFIKQLMNVITDLNQNVVKVETSNILTLIERQVIGTLHDSFFNAGEFFYKKYMQNPNVCLGIGTSGGTLANISAMSFALNRLFSARGSFKGIAQEGIFNTLRYFNFEKVVIVGSERMHYSIDKAAKLIGLGKDAVIRIKTTTNGTIDIDVLESTLKSLNQSGIKILSIVGVAGSTETGSIDPLKDLALIAENYQAHFHVDAAWGGPLIFSEKYKHLLSGIDQADSVTICGHKQLYLPIGISFCIFKDPDFASHSENNTAYQCKKNSHDLGRYTLEGTRPASSLLLHALLMAWGAQGIGIVMNNNIKMANYFSNLIKNEIGFELFESPKTNIVVYRCRIDESIDFSPEEKLKLENDLNYKIQKHMFEHGHDFISLTELTCRQKNENENKNVVVFRAVFCNHQITEASIQRLICSQGLLFKKMLNELHQEVKNVVNLV